MRMQGTKEVVNLVEVEIDIREALTALKEVALKKAGLNPNAWYEPGKYDREWIAEEECYAGSHSYYETTNITASVEQHDLLTALHQLFN